MTRIVTYATAALLACASVAAAAPSASQREHARQLFVKGKKAYAAGKYAAAIKSFEAAGKIKASPILDFNVARCFDKLGKLEPAVAHYRRYLAARPKAKNRAEVDRRVKALQAAIAAKKKADPYEDLEHGKHKGPAKTGGKPWTGAKPPTPTKKAAVAPLTGAVTGVAKVAGTDHGDGDASAAASQPAKVATAKAPAAAAKRKGPAEAAHPKKKIPHEATLPIAMRPPPTRSGAKAKANANAGASGSAGASAAASANGKHVASASGDSDDDDKGKDDKDKDAGKSGALGGKRDDGGAHKPVYKQWWFWVAIGAGVAITTFIIATAAGSSDRNPSTTGALSSQSGGLTVLSF